MSTINTAFGRKFVETIFVPKVAKDKDGNEIVVGFTRIPAVWDHHDKPVAEREYYPGDPLVGGRALIQRLVREAAEREARKQFSSMSHDNKSVVGNRQRASRH